MLAIEGETATFVADIAGLAGSDDLHYSWRVSGAEGSNVDSPSIEVRMPASSGPVTVSVTITGSAGRVGFGTRTIVPLTEIDALRFEIVNLLREMVTPGDPSGAFVMTTFDPTLISRGLVTVNIPWIRDRAKRLGEVTAQLLEIWSRDDTRPVVDDPRHPWSRN
jgi:hypothetical protein